MSTAFKNFKIILSQSKIKNKGFSFEMYVWHVVIVFDVS